MKNKLTPGPKALELVKSIEVSWVPELLGYRYMITVENGATYFLFIEEGRQSKQMNPETWGKP